MSRRPSEGDWLHAVSHPSRIDILRRFLVAGTATPADIAHGLELPLGNVSYHIRLLAEKGIVRLAGRTQRRGAVVHHYQLTDRERTASIVWGMRATLLVSDFERENGRADVTARLDVEALGELRSLTADFLVRLGELGLQTRERRGSEDPEDGSALTRVAVLLAADGGDAHVVG